MVGQGLAVRICEICSVRLSLAGVRGFSGDEQADRKHHGGVEKAVCVYPVEHYEYWHEHLPELALPHGAFGENLTTSGLLESGVSVGDVYELGEAIVQVSQPRQPCWKLARRWRVKDLSARWSARASRGFTSGCCVTEMLRPGMSWC
ncbi:MOSC domain-containing protein [Verrucomicrobium spinosum]|uniref:MOSC domain-containing protein n=1 Tax=Verrucomicrobium spinosum TaxID=2736 RepID=UPI001C456B2C|nr:MOSC domain-containing protein [Verrucomicrobium spinosum]